VIRRLTLAVALLLAQTVTARAQVAIQLRDVGPGVGADILARAVASPHTVLPPVSGQRLIRADSSYARTVIALGSTVIVEGTIHGDLLVVGGDLFMHPGGRIDGRAIAIGGGVYESMLAHTGSVLAFRDYTYDIEPVAGGFALSYHPFSISADTTATLSLPGIKGFGIPTYDRINGLSIGFGPLFRVPNSPIRVEPRLTYRSHLGKLDPSVSAGTLLDRRTALRLNAGRGTYSNDAWIWSDFVNSGEFALVGDDTRNYYRATRADLSVARLFESAASTLEPYIGARVERGTSVPRDSVATSAPWTLLNRRDQDDGRRPNPRINEGAIVSAVAGARYEWTAEGGIIGAAKIDGEVGGFGARSASGVSCAAPASCNASSFGQLTLDGSIAFPTFGLQTLRFDMHAVATAARQTPRQRYAYVGGPGTISTLELLEQGGDQLIFLDGRYTIPFSRVVLPLIGSPTVTVREVLAGAAVKRFPTLAQGTGARIAAGFLYFEFLVDPVHGRATKGFGISIAR
jgi:hypothetical protein